MAVIWTEGAKIGPFYIGRKEFNGPLVLKNRVGSVWPLRTIAKRVLSLRFWRLFRVRPAIHDASGSYFYGSTPRRTLVWR